MVILVTGAAGFIGFHLVEKLVKEGHNIIGIDNINDYYDINLKYSRLSQSGIDRNLVEDDQSANLVLSNKYNNYQFAKMDLCDKSALESLFKKNNFTHVVNLAAQAGVRYSIENPDAYVQSNLVGFVNILECCRNYKIKHLVYASSSSVYGQNIKVPFSEHDQVDNPVSLYAATKKSNELMAHTYSHLYNFNTTGLRFFTVYGPYGRPDMAPMLFANAIKKGDAIKVFNNGEMERDFTYIDDIVEGVARVIKYDLSADDELYKVLNIGNSKPVKLFDFINIMEEAMGTEAQKVMYPMQDGDVKRTYADTTELEKLVGYKPKTSLKEGVGEFVKWFKKGY
ncbi:NAD-dependent epimerase [Saccharicrinis aurantiacus]|uniref:NAD-dependent epimerase n=1 Tax=Saccharicrinis aurantiacus TaxID=1849719 RepID=UPI0024927954|nr:NAD-dependent epimerase [Saccharicrinis aurantiacus]